MKDIRDLAKRNCRECGATGKLANRDICSCVHAKMFSECLQTYRMCREQQAAYSTSTVVELINGMPYCSRPSEEYIVDFERICAKTCTGPGQLSVFKSLLLDSSRNLSGPLQAQFGKALSEIRPYALYPPSSYFNPAILIVVQQEGE